MSSLEGPFRGAFGNFKEVLIHNHSQQIFSADFFSRSSQQIFSADFLQQIFSADLLSRSSQQIFSADLLSRSSQQIFSADLLSRSSHCLIICCGQGLVVSYCLIICCGQGLVVNYCLIMLVVYVGGLYCMSSLEGPFRGAFGKIISRIHLSRRSPDDVCDRISARQNQVGQVKTFDHGKCGSFSEFSQIQSDLMHLDSTFYHVSVLMYY